MLILGAEHSVGDSTGGRYRVSQQVSPRVVIVELANDATKEELQMMSDVEAVFEPGERPSDDLVGTLTETEVLFVEAYTQQTKPKERPGEGLDWDAEGFLPPDPPVKH